MADSVLYYQVPVDVWNQYYWGTYGGIMVCIVLVVVLVVGWYFLRPVMGYLKSRNRPDRPLMQIFRKNGRVSLEPGKYQAEVYERQDREDPLAFFKNDKSNWKLGQADLELFYDSANVAINPEITVAIRQLKNLGFKNIEEVALAVNKGELSKETFHIPLLTQFDPSWVVDYVKGKPATMKAWGDTKVNIDRARRAEKFYENPQIMSLGFIIVCACIGFGILKSMNVF